MDQSIWAPRGPEKESMGAVLVQPLPTSYLIFRAPSSAAGKCWMDALELRYKIKINVYAFIAIKFILSLRCSALLVRSFSTNAAVDDDDDGDLANDSTVLATSTHETQWSEADYEKHFNEHGSTCIIRLGLIYHFEFRFAICAFS